MRDIFQCYTTYCLEKIYITAKNTYINNIHNKEIFAVYTI